MFYWNGIPTCKVIGDDLSTITPCSHYIFTGKGIKMNSYHLGHFILSSHLARLSKDYQILYQVSDLQKTLPESFNPALQPIKDYTLEFLSTIEFNPSNVLLFFDSENFEWLSAAANLIATKIKSKTLKNLFGDNMTLYSQMYYCYQLSPLLLSSKFFKKKPLIVTAEDQIGPFLLARQVCKKLKLPMPTIIVVESLKDIFMKEKMSSSNPKSAVRYEHHNGWNTYLIRKAISGVDNNSCFGQHLQYHLKTLGLEIPFYTSSLALKEHLSVVLNSLKCKLQQRLKPINIRTLVNTESSSVWNNLNELLQL